MNKELKKSINAANLEFKEEPMDDYYNNKILGFMSRLRVKKVIKEIDNIKNKNVLDVGCEAGYVSINLAKKDANVTSFDIIGYPLDIFKERIKNNVIREKIKILNAAAQYMPFHDNIFDVIICTEGIEHMPQLDKVFSEMKRVAKKNGKIIITFPNEDSREKIYPIIKFFGINTDVEKDVTLFKYKLEDIVKLLKKYFVIEKSYSIPLFFPLTRIIVCKNN